jgi:caa(3)-type oxidase subunit IV
MSEDGHHTNYVKIWAILMVLLFVSIIGPEFGIRWLTLFTAFGIACIKAYMVATKFMHIDKMPSFVSYIVITCLVFMLLFFSAVAPDVMNDTGSNWVKPTWVAGTENDWVTVGGHMEDAGHGAEASHGESH